MNETKENKINIPADGLNTEKGLLYPMATKGKQIITLISSFFAAILLGLIISSIPGDLSELATGVLYFVFITIFVLGYSTWIGWLKLILLSAFKKTIVKGFSSIVTKKEFDLAKELQLPEDKMVELMLRVQKSTKIFAVIGWVFGVLGGFISLSFDTSMNKPILFVLVIIFAAGYGHLLYYFGRRGYFPFPEE
ncbi:MAG TPA: hypothetical protein PKD03_15000 [Ignavibacteriaceae bacterium]|nr:hypothetical protein [Ignavibacteriaceae bacterium]